MPDTWEDTVDVCKYFNDLDLKARDGTKMYCGYFYMDPGWAALTTFVAIFTPNGGILFRVGEVSLDCLTGKQRVFTYGQKVYVKFKEEKAHVFLRETGMALGPSTN